MATIEISEHDKKIIFETAEDILRRHPGRTRLRPLWAVMRQERHELDALHKNHSKVKGYWKEIVAILHEWQQRHPTKIGCAKIPRGTEGYKKNKKYIWFWYGGAELPEPSSIENPKGDEEEIEISEDIKKIMYEMAVDILRKHPGRTRFSSLWSAMRQEHPELAELHKKSHKKVKGFWQGIRAIMCRWQQKYKTKIGFNRIKKSKYVDRKDVGYWFWYRENDSKEIPQPSSLMIGGGEESKFYIPFAEWLEKQKECTKAISTGDKVRGKKKWSNPDVVGVKKSPWLDGKTDYELVSVEIKTSTNTGDIITGFGQSCAYKLFSHKSYLVVPSDSNTDDLQRIKDLCEQHNIGLVVFDKNNPDNPAFELRCSAKRSERPNISYVNATIKELLKKDGYDIF